MAVKGWYRVANTFTADWIRNHIEEELVWEMTDGTIHIGRVHTLYKNAVKLKDGVKLFFNKIEKIDIFKGGVSEE